MTRSKSGGGRAACAEGLKLMLDDDDGDDDDDAAGLGDSGATMRDTGLERRLG